MRESYDSDDYSGGEDVSVVLPLTKLLSKMTGDQASELIVLERIYEEVVLREVDKFERNEDDSNKLKEELGWTNGCYNPIWAEEGEKSVELYPGSSKSKSPSFYPQRIPLSIPEERNLRKSTRSPLLNSDSELEFSLDDYSSSDSEAENEHKNIKMSSFEPRKIRTKKQKEPILAESILRIHPMEDADNPPGDGKHTPPKDFVCPITSHVFDDPVTLETGQTYERKAIQEWIERGNSTCPITRQKLHSTQLPKTNYVLKRLIASWQEDNSGSLLSPSESPLLEPEQMSQVNSTFNFS
ncbi:hypothetical protein Patl1_13282 [Pistacia atlantica]|uniref:Uncharacterized protein n=1 Tax=Pistacia atlantica TaxID=434234 RepID=A0ACC1AWM3_9ROSI|nr:hypothetical protein Patl1_13282 [Pistacia atlantica]